MGDLCSKVRDEEQAMQEYMTNLREKIQRKEAEGDESEKIHADEPGWSKIAHDTMRQVLNTGSAYVTIGTPPSDDGYDSLRVVLAQAVEQASGGKGTERHSNGQPFDQQPICQGGRRFGIAGLVYQCWKKSHEVPVLLTMDDGKARAVRELLGVINYAAAAIIVLQEGSDGME
jgi:hypothetical protein